MGGGVSPMAALSKLSVLKLGFAMAGLATFGVGLRVDDARVRWIGIALVAIAWLLRFAAPRRSAGQGAPEADGQLPDDTR